MNGHAAFVLGPAQLVGLAILGLLIGLIGGMFGLGGGFLTVPLLTVVFGIPVEQAVATGLSTGIGTAVAAWRRHRRLKQAEEKLDWLMLPGSLLGVGLGSATLHHLEKMGGVEVAGHSITAAKLWVSIGYVLLLTFVGLWVLADARRFGEAAIKAGWLTKLHLPPMILLPKSGQRISVFIATYLGLFIGFLGGLLGLGGGILLLPVMMYGIGMRMRTAAGAAVLLLVATTMLGTYQHARNVLLVPTMLLLAGSTIVAPFGASVTANMDGKRLRQIFGFLVIATAVSVILNLLHTIQSGPSV